LRFFANPVSVVTVWLENDSEGTFTTHIPITCVTSGMVTPVSAIFVLRTILRIPVGGVSKTLACSALVSFE